MTQEGNTFAVAIEAAATATHPPGTVVHPDGSLTAPQDDHEGTDTP